MFCRYYINLKMIYFNFLFAFLLIFNTISADYALKIEEIIGGYPTVQSDFKYHAAIMGKYNSTHVTHLLCSAGIISSFLLMSAARCFLHSGNALRKFRFYAVVGEDVLVYRRNLQEINQIYIYHYSDFYIESNPAIAKLRDGLDLVDSINLAQLDIPDIEENFDGATGRVAGFGINSINNLKKNKNREQVRVSGTNMLYLNYAMVLIINGGQFKQFYDKSHFGSLICGQLMEHFLELCGVIPSDETYEHRGVCLGDVGSPLVVGNKIIGIVNKFHKNCDDTKFGTTYIRVSKFKSFIDGIKTGDPISDTKVYDNPIYVRSQKLSASAGNSSRS